MIWLIASLAVLAAATIVVRIARARERLRAIEHEAAMCLRSLGGTL